VIVAWDGRVPKFRRQLVPSYKADRHKDEDPAEREDFNRQMDELHTYALPRLGILSVRRQHVEADDLLHHASRISMHERNVIVTGDKDLLQSITDNTFVYSPNKEILYDRSKFEESYGLPLPRFVVWKSIQGDGSDNIPGVRGIGEVTATKLLNNVQWSDDLRSVYESLIAGTSKAAKLLKEFGYDNLCKNMQVMDLSLDKTGSRYALLEEVKFYRETDRKVVKNYLLRSAFVSLMDNLPSLAAYLTVPQFDKTARYPIIVERTPLEDI
jgi:DNA polymerase-1